MVILDKQISERKWKPNFESEKIYQNHYKKLHKILDQNEFTETPNSHLTNMILEI